MEDEFLVSVIMSVYKRVDYLDEAINSILNQTYNNLELIIVLEKSEFQEQIKNYINEKYDDVRIKLICNKEKLGFAQSLNVGLENAKGQYIARMDDDDISYPNRLQIQIDYLNQNQNVDICGSDIKCFYPNGKTEIDQGTYLSNESIKLGLLTCCAIPHPTAFMRRNIIDEGWRYSLDEKAEDSDFWSRLILYKQIERIPIPLLLYRVHNEQATKVYRKEVQDSVYSIIKRYYNNLLQMDVSHYSLQELTYSRNFIRITNHVSFYMKRQMKLLQDVYYANKDLNVVSEKAMCRYIDMRVTNVIHSIGLDSNYVMYCLDKSFTVQTIKSIILKDILNVSINRTSYFSKNVESVLIGIEKFVSDHCYVEHAFAIYGIGNLGIQLLEEYISLNEIKKWNWKLKYLIDKNVKVIQVKDENFKVNKLEDIKQEELDYVMISSDKYFDEIKEELIQSGIDSSKIIGVRWINFIENDSYKE